MEEKDLAFLNSFTEKLSDTLVKQCTADGMLEGKMLMVEELNEKWRTSAPEYMVDAVPQIAEYPSAAIAWACYVGAQHGPSRTPVPTMAACLRWAGLALWVQDFGGHLIPR